MHQRVNVSPANREQDRVGAPQQNYHLIKREHSPGDFG
jgi:hypothetical protein